MPVPVPVSVSPEPESFPEPVSTGISLCLMTFYKYAKLARLLWSLPKVKPHTNSIVRRKRKAHIAE